MLILLLTVTILISLLLHFFGPLYRCSHRTQEAERTRGHSGWRLLRVCLCWTLPVLLDLIQGWGDQRNRIQSQKQNRTDSSDFFLTLGLFIYLFILFMAVLGLRFCARAFSSCGERGPLFIAVRGPLTVAASLVAEHGLQTRRLSNCGSRA